MASPSGRLNCAFWLLPGLGAFMPRRAPAQEVLLHNATLFSSLFTFVTTWFSLFPLDAPAGHSCPVRLAPSEGRPVVGCFLEPVYLGDC